jgi:hypothetical protein
MSATLYLLRQRPDRISPSLFLESDADMDIVFVEHATLRTLSPMKGATVSNEGRTVSDSRQTLTYEDLVEKIFSSEHIIIL